jgi:hypothetical protein
MPDIRPRIPQKRNADNETSLTRFAAVDRALALDAVDRGDDAARAQGQEVVSDVVGDRDEVGSHAVPLAVDKGNKDVYTFCHVVMQ